MRGIFQHNNGVISYEINKKGNLDETVVFIHGFGLNKRQWSPQTEALLKNNISLLTYDLRGYGESSLPKSKYSHTEDLKNLMDYLEIEKATLCAHSFGSAFAIDFALKYPEKTNALLLISPSLGSLSSENKENGDRMKRWAELARNGHINIIKSEILEHHSLDALRQNPQGYKLIADIINSYSCWHFSHADPGEKLYRAIETLPEIEKHVEIIMGKEESENDKRVLVELLSKSKNVVLKFLPGGHFLNIENSKEVNDAIIKLVEQKKYKI